MEKLVIGLMGVKESGKSTVAQILAEDHEFAILEPGMQVMELLLDINPTIDLRKNYVPEIPQYPDGSPFAATVSEVYDAVGYLGFKALPEGRRLLQELGTRIRERDPYFWVNQQLSVIESNEGNIVNASVRFENEARLISAYEGQLWYVENDRVEDSADHESETAWRDLVPAQVIENNGTLSDLRETVRNAIMSLG
jgi:hypothetical protein